MNKFEAMALGNKPTNTNAASESITGFNTKYSTRNKQQSAARAKPEGVSIVPLVRFAPATLESIA